MSSTSEPRNSLSARASRNWLTWTRTPKDKRRPRGGTLPDTPDEHAGDEVSPLELFFDLVFVFAVSQLSHHLLEHVSWRGALESAVLLIAVFGVWSYASWGSALPGVRQGGHRWTLLVVMVLGLLMNAGIGEGFTATPWLFVVPFVLCRVGPVIWWRLSSSQLREHYTATLIWFSLTAVVWALGATASPEHRLWWWTGAAAAELGGTWLAHPIPGRSFRTREVAFAPGHMLERSRLFLLIALGEAILTTGTAVAAAELSVLMVVTAVLAMTAIICLWALYFRGSDQLIAEQAETTADPLRVARLAINTQILVLASLIMLAVAAELIIEDPTRSSDPSLSLLLFGGPLLYIAVQSWYLRVVTEGRTRLPVLVLGLLAAAAAFGQILPGVMAMVVLALILGSTLAFRRPELTAP